MHVLYARLLDADVSKLHLSEFLFQICSVWVPLFVKQALLETTLQVPSGLQSSLSHECRAGAATHPGTRLPRCKIGVPCNCHVRHWRVANSEQTSA